MAINVLRPLLLGAMSALLTLGAGSAVAAESPTAGPGPGSAAVSGLAAASANIAATNDSGSGIASPTVADTVMPASQPPAVNPSVGTLFAGGGHFCSASVVHSAAGDVVLTAAHCVDGGSGVGNRTGLSFAPGYHDGVAPYGVWTVTSVVVPAGWSSSSDPDLDFAFLTVKQAANPATVESLTGANQLGIDHGFANRITLSGYPDITNSPVVCRNTTTKFGSYQQRIVCAGFPDGTSGGPWVTDVNPSTGYGTVIGVIGGYELGGDSPNVSYSAYFDADIQRLYNSVTG